MLIFGPVPSRRLGRSLGVNNIPPKSCTYSCVYCQVGPTHRTEAVPRAFYAPARIAREVEQHLSRLRERGARVDYLTLVPDGEPTLDEHLGETIERLKVFGIPIAVISNGSLLSHNDVRERLSKADWVSLKLDAMDSKTWRRINRPDPALDHAQMLDGMVQFASRFEGTLATETMLVAGVNDDAAHAEALGGFLGRLPRSTPTSRSPFVLRQSGVRCRPSRPASIGSTRSCSGKSTIWSC